MRRCGAMIYSAKKEKKKEKKRKEKAKSCLGSSNRLIITIASLRFTGKVSLVDWITQRCASCLLLETLRYRQNLILVSAYSSWRICFLERCVGECRGVRLIGVREPSLYVAARPPPSATSVVVSHYLRPVSCNPNSCNQYRVCMAYCT